MEESSGDRPPRSRGINPEKLKDVDQMKKVPIFQRTKLNNIDFLYQSFPVEGIIMFCNKFRQEVQKDKAVYLPEGNTEASSMIFDWIQRCLDAGSIEDFEISDEYSPGVFSRYADIVNAAEYLEIPDRDVAEKVIKRLKGMARMQRDQDRRITFDELEDFYVNRSEDLAKLASSTIFYSWWYGHLDFDSTPEEMCELSALRSDYPDLDQDLHDHVSEHDEFLKARQQKRDAEKNGTGDDGNTAGGWDTENSGGGTAVASGWDTDAAAATAGDWNVGNTTAAVGGWNAGATTASTGAWNNPDAGDAAGVSMNKENVAPVDGNISWDQTGETNDWADEVIESVPQVPVSAW